MKILSFGSLNYDHVYNTSHFVMPKETLSAANYSRGFGGKGLNQSIAMARAGLEVYHAGRVGADGQPFIDYLRRYGVFTDLLIKDDSAVTGHAIIEVCEGQNRIILHGGSNRMIDSPQIDSALAHFGSGDILVIQNEISSLPYLIREAKKHGMKIFFNAAPMDDHVSEYPLGDIDILCVNEVEGQLLAEIDDSNPEMIGKAIIEKYPELELLLTVGEKGSFYFSRREQIYVPAEKVKAVDTTAAGDTYIGFFLAGLNEGMSITDSMKLATSAAAITVQRAGAADSIPDRFIL